MKKRIIIEVEHTVGDKVWAVVGVIKDWKVVSHKVVFAEILTVILTQVVAEKGGVRIVDGVSYLVGYDDKTAYQFEVFPTKESAEERLRIRNNQRKCLSMN